MMKAFAALSLTGALFGMLVAACAEFGHERNLGLLVAAICFLAAYAFMLEAKL